MNELLRMLFSERGKRGTVASYRGTLLLLTMLVLWQQEKITDRIQKIEIRLALAGIAESDTAIDASQGRAALSSARRTRDEYYERFTSPDRLSHSNIWITTP